MSDFQYAFEAGFFMIVIAASLATIVYGLCVFIRKYLDTRMQNQKRIANSARYAVGRDAYRFTKGVHHQ